MAEEATVSLREYVDARLTAFEKMGEAAMRNGEAYIAQFHELRNQVNSERGMFTTRDAFEMGVTDVQRRLDEIAARIAKMEIEQATTARNARRTAGIITFAISVLGAAFIFLNWARGLPF